MVLALNMMDEVTGNGGTIDVKGNVQALGIPVVPISAAKNEGVDELVKIVRPTGRNQNSAPRSTTSAPGPVHRCIHAVVHQIEDHARAGIQVRFAATKLIEGDEDICGLAWTRTRRSSLSTPSGDGDDSGMDRNAAWRICATTSSRGLRRHGGKGRRIQGAAAQRSHRPGGDQQIPGPAHVLRHHGWLFYLTFLRDWTVLSDLLAMRDRRPHRAVDDRASPPTASTRWSTVWSSTACSPAWAAY